MVKKLTAAFVKTVSEPGKYGDQHGLILRVLPSGAKQWIWRGTVHGRRRDLGLGGFPYVSLAEARQQAFDYRKLARSGADPMALKGRPDVPTFEQALEEVLAVHQGSWRDGGKSEQQWRASLRDYAIPQLGCRPVDAITTADVMAVLVPIWNEKRVTAQRVRQRIGAIMRWAIAQGYRGDNPAGEAIAEALPRNNGVKTHHRALPHGEVAAALVRVRASEAWPATKLAFEFLVLSACRSGEVRGARWDEIDIEAATWTVPALRTKAGREHRVPLSTRALGVLDEARALADGSGLVFPSLTGRALASNTLSGLCGDSDIRCVPHGFRSSFRDWAAEQTDTPHAVMEAALAHVNPNQAEAAYARSDLFERRRKLMEQWAGYLAQGRSKVPAVVPRHG